ncbi:MAG TPA: hypothetical protein VMT74_07555 [Gaiellaceae bacterium]|nr:hypothetical protein [Gaiellaceae bacterium]
MAEQSHREEMSAAIRAQRERQAVPRTLAGVDERAAETAPEPASEAPPGPKAEPRKGRFSRFLRG